MTVTSHLFEAYLKCPTKCWLRSTGEPPTSNTYAEWVQTQTESYRIAGSERLLSGLPQDDCAPPSHSRGNEAHSSAEDLKAANWRLAVDFLMQTLLIDSTSDGSRRPKEVHSEFGTAHTELRTKDQSLVTSAATAPGNDPQPESAIECRLHAVERVSSGERGKPIQLIPIRFVFTNQLGTDDKLMLAFDALALSNLLGHEVSLGKIVHGDGHATLKVKTSALVGDVRKRLDKIAALLASPSPPDLVLNRHCPECEFQVRCRQKAMEKDDLSLLSGMSEKERRHHRSKGIFTVNQLSYTFRPRRTPKRAENLAKPHCLPLQALSIRENKVHIHGNPQLPESKSSVYLDIEGLPDNAFYYLIGILVVSDGQETFHAFWANQKSDEPMIFGQLAEAVCQLGDFRVLHFGKYETVALRRMKAELPACLHPKIDRILERATNVLSVVHPHIYFPTYSNGLKDIGRFLGCDRTHGSATGLQTIVWRKGWETNSDPDLKASLLQYNQDDCLTLKHLCELITRLTCPDSANPAVPQTLPATRTEEMTKERPRWEMFGVRQHALEDFKHINECAYFDYQRDKVFVRTHRQLRSINKRHRNLQKTNTHPNRIINLECKRCPRCQKKRIEQTKQFSHLLIDLKFARTGVKKWITSFRSYRYQCRKCRHRFGSEVRSRGRATHRYGHGFRSWCVYSSFFCDMKMSRTRIALGDTFGIFVDESRMMRCRERMAAEYEGLYSAILHNLVQDKILHADETSVKLRGSKGYVWVLASMDKVYYLYKPTREGSFLQEMLHPFSGVLISDFYTAYDSLNCEQQKCLVHFVRDIDDDVLKNPLDTDLKGIAQEFGILLRTIIATVDRYGLKSRHLRKHKSAVLRFLDSVASKHFSSELADSYKKRFQKGGAKMFTFLDHDGVPWNNINAEHAIKRFAKFRTHANGRFSERTLKEYLVLASVFQTCEFNNVNVLEFLLSKETTLDGLLKMAGRRPRKLQRDKEL